MLLSEFFAVISITKQGLSYQYQNIDLCGVCYYVKFGSNPVINVQIKASVKDAIYKIAKMMLISLNIICVK